MSKKMTVLAAAVMAATVMQAQAAEEPDWANLTSKVDETFNVAGDQTAGFAWKQMAEGTYEFTQTGLVSGLNVPSGEQSSAFLMGQGNAQFNIAESATIYVRGDGGYTAGVSLGYNSTASVVNNGTIYAGGNTAGVDKVKAISVDDGSAVNNGKIYVWKALGMSSNTQGSAEANTLENNGAIEAYAGGRAMIVNRLSDGNTANVVNNGTLTADGATSSALYVARDVAGGSINITNTGLISAANGATAIANYSSTADVSMLFEGEQSDVVGRVFILGQKTGMTFSGVGETSMELSAAHLKSLTLQSKGETGSNLTLSGTGTTTIDTLSMDNASMLSIDGNRTLNVTTLEGAGEHPVAAFSFDHFGDEPVLTIGTNKVESTDVSFTAEAIDGLSAEEAAAALKSAVDLGTVDGTDQGAAAAGTIEGNGTNFTVTVDENGNARVDGSDITKQTADLAAMTLVAWRNETTTITDRMASLRTNPQTYGAWVRWNGGAYDFDDRDLSNDFNTIEVGGDMKVDPNWVLGASFSYTKGDGDFAQGETESDAYAGALYALWTHEKGSFLDMVMKTGRISTDFDFYNLKGGATDNGTLDQTGFILSVETGHRFALPMNTFVEPQIQLQYSRLASVDEKTAERRVELDPSISLIGRVGVMAGLECPNDRGTVWVKASALRDFKGDVDGMVANADGSSSYEISEELDQNWAELALGADVKVTDNVYAFADVQKSFGGDIELDWRANVGAKIVW